MLLGNPTVDLVAAQPLEPQRLALARLDHRGQDLEVARFAPGNPFAGIDFLIGQRQDRGALAQRRLGQRRNFGIEPRQARLERARECALRIADGGGQLLQALDLAFEQHFDCFAAGAGLVDRLRAEADEVFAPADLERGEAQRGLLAAGLVRGDDREHRRTGQLRFLLGVQFGEFWWRSRGGLGGQRGCEKRGQRGDGGKTDHPCHIGAVALRVMNKKRGPQARGEPRRGPLEWRAQRAGVGCRARWKSISGARRLRSFRRCTWPGPLHPALGPWR